MKKINILQKNEEFSRIIKKQKANRYHDYYIYIETVDNSSKFGISIGKKIGNAVVRNKIKRQIKSIIDKNAYQNSFNCIIIVRKSVLDRSFQEMSDDIYNIFSSLKIIKEKKNEKENNINN